MKQSVLLRQALAFRQPMPVTKVLLLKSGYAYPLCPRCDISMEREHQRFCDRCGQCLAWKGYRNAQVVYPRQDEQ